MTSLCTWCGTEFEPRSNGGEPQRFCSTDCRQDFNTACRIWGAQEYEAERVSIFDLRTCLEQRARSLGRDLGSEGAPTYPRDREASWRARTAVIRKGEATEVRR